MTQPVRFLFDECISRPLVETRLAQSLELYGACATVAHLLGRYPQNVKDPVWITEIAREGGWVVVTMDRGMHGKRIERLPIVCHAFRVTHVMLSPGLAKRTMLFRMLAIEACWSDLIAACDYPPGTQFLLSMREKKGSSSFHLTKTKDALCPEDAPLVQKSLLDQWGRQ